MSTLPLLAIEPVSERGTNGIVPGLPPREESRDRNARIIPATGGCEGSSYAVETNCFRRDILSIHPPPRLPSLRCCLRQAHCNSANQPRGDSHAKRGPDSTRAADRSGIDTRRYAKVVEVSKRIRWEIERDVIRGRAFDFSRKFLPDGLTKIGRLPFLTQSESVLFSQIQGRTYANMFGLVERAIGAKMLEISSAHWLGDQTALEALVRFTDEELKHQELFRRIERMIAAGMADGYRFDAEPNAVARVILGKSTWAVLALICMIELFTQQHYRASIETDSGIAELYKDVFLFHWREESQHAILDELEWRQENARVSARERDAAVDDLIALAGAVDGIVREQAAADADYFFARSKRVIQLRRSRAGARRVSRRVSLAVHRFGRAGRALFGRARRDDHPGAGRAHRRRAGADRGIDTSTRLSGVAAGQNFTRDDKGHDT